MADSSEQSYKKCGEFLAHVSDYQLLKKYHMNHGVSHESRKTTKIVSGDAVLCLTFEHTTKRKKKKKPDVQLVFKTFSKTAPTIFLLM